MKWFLNLMELLLEEFEICSRVIGLSNSFYLKEFLVTTGPKVQRILQLKSWWAKNYHTDWWWVWIAVPYVYVCLFMFMFTYSFCFIALLLFLIFSNEHSPEHYDIYDVKSPLYENWLTTALCIYCCLYKVFKLSVWLRSSSCIISYLESF